MPEERSRLVYSTDGTEAGRTQPPKAPPAARSTERRGPAKPSSVPPADGIVRVQRTSRGHGGKTVTIVTGLPGNERELEALLKTLKQLCGAGGTREGATIEIQGDHRDRLHAKLESLGHRVKLAGG